MRRTDDDPGQASVELVGMLPIVLIVALALFSAFTVMRARESAAAAAQAGAVALLQGEDATRAARSALPGVASRRARVHVSGGRVTVRVIPAAAFEPFARRLAVEATADAGSRSR